MLTLDESGRRVARHHWVETRMFALVGAWVASTPETEPKLLFDRHSLHHSWRAKQWYDRLPVLADVDRDELVDSQGAPLLRAFDFVAALGSTLERMACAYRVLLPRLAVAYERHRLLCGEVSDSSVRRTLTIVSRDLRADWLEGETVLQGLLDAELEAAHGQAATAARAAEAATSLEAFLVGDAGL